MNLKGSRVWALVVIGLAACGKVDVEMSAESSAAESTITDAAVLSAGDAESSPPEVSCYELRTVGITVPLSPATDTCVAGFALDRAHPFSFENTVGIPRRFEWIENPKDPGGAPCAPGSLEVSLFRKDIDANSSEPNFGIDHIEVVHTGEASACEAPAVLDAPSGFTEICRAFDAPSAWSSKPACPQLTATVANAPGCAALRGHAKNFQAKAVQTEGIIPELDEAARLVRNVCQTSLPTEVVSGSSPDEARVQALATVGAALSRTENAWRNLNAAEFTYANLTNTFVPLGFIADSKQCRDETCVDACHRVFTNFLVTTQSCSVQSGALADDAARFKANVVRLQSVLNAIVVKAAPRPVPQRPGSERPAIALPRPPPPPRFGVK